MEEASTRAHLMEPTAGEALGEGGSVAGRSEAAGYTKARKGREVEVCNRIDSSKTWIMAERARGLCSNAGAAVQRADTALQGLLPEQVQAQGCSGQDICRACHHNQLTRTAVQ